MVKNRLEDIYSIENLTNIVDCVLISHFHLDHSGALPYMSEIVGYDGPIIMTEPTRAIVPYMLEDFRKIAVETREIKDLNKDNTKEIKEIKDQESKNVFYTSEHIAKCIKKVGSYDFLTIVLCN